MSTEISRDVSREGVTLPKITQPFRLLTPEGNYAIAKLTKFTALNVGQLAANMNLDIKGMILDVDECIAPHHGEITDENLSHALEITRAGVKIAIFSNMKDNGRYRPLLEHSDGAVQVIHSPYAKPDPRGFQACLDALELDASQVIMVGDNPVTDGGSTRLEIPFVQIRPIQSQGELSVKRAVQVSIRDFYVWLSGAYDQLLWRTVHTDWSIDGKY